MWKDRREREKLARGNRDNRGDIERRWDGEERKGERERK